MRIAKICTNYSQNTLWVKEKDFAGTQRQNNSKTVQQFFLKVYITRTRKYLDEKNKQANIQIFPSNMVNISHFTKKINFIRKQIHEYNIAQST